MTNICTPNPTTEPLCKITLGVNFEGNNYYTELLITDRDENGRLTGRINSSRVNCRFFWEQGEYPLPFCTMLPNRSGRTSPLSVGKEFAKATINTLACQALVHNPSDKSFVESQGTYISQLIRDGHVRKPHVARLANGNLCIRKATVVNPTTLSDLDRKKYETVRDLWNFAVSAYRQHTQLLTFEEWKARYNPMGNHEGYYAHYASSVSDAVTKVAA